LALLVTALDNATRSVTVVAVTQGARQLAKLFERPSQKEIAKRLKLSPSYFSLLVSGKRTPSMAVAGRIQKELGIPVEAWTK